MFHILARSEWHDAVAKGVYEPASLRREGFIHCSTLEQIVETANRWYCGQRDLVLLAIEADRLAAELRFEPPANPADERRAEIFPHLYGPLNLNAAVEVIAFPADAGGTFRLPAALAADSQ